MRGRARLLPILVLAAVIGITAAVSMQVRAQFRMRDAELAAAKTMTAIVEAQRAFRRTGGGGGYATDLQSLLQPCPALGGASLGTLSASAYQYRVTVRGARRASAVGTDCHGRPTASDFYASVEPMHEWAGRQAMATTARGRPYVFFDGLAPLERDMEAGGLAVPLDTLGTFKIP